MNQEYLSVGDALRGEDISSYGTIITRSEAQIILCCKKTYYFQKIAEGRLDPVRIAGKTCVTLASVERFRREAAEATKRGEKA